MIVQSFIIIIISVIDVEVRSIFPCLKQMWGGGGGGVNCCDANFL